jgi:hypothetical protein
MRRKSKGTGHKSTGASSPQGAGAAFHEQDTWKLVPAYFEAPNGNVYEVYVVGFGRSAPAWTSPHPLLQRGVDAFWDALRQGVSGKELLCLFEASLPVKVCTDLLSFPPAAMKTLGDYDLRLADPIAKPIIGRLVGDWLEKYNQSKHARSSVRRKRGAKVSPEVAKRRENLHLRMNGPEDLSDEKKVRNLFATLEVGKIPIPGHIQGSTEWLDLLGLPRNLWV